MGPITRSRGAPLLILLLAGCNRHQSALHTFGEDAAGIGSLTLLLVSGAVIILAGVLVLMAVAVRLPEGRLTLRGGERLILWAGGIAPAVLLLALLAYSLPLMRPRAAEPTDLRIAVEGEQFWWRVRYLPAGAPPVAAANEVRLPVGRTVVLRLTAPDVIHSFWIPGLAGKTDMIPGRENLMTVRATSPGRYRGQCTEFCGLGHALMAFDVVAMEPAAFDAWLALQARGARPGEHAGRMLFADYGCGGCHAIRGTDEAGVIAPTSPMSVAATP